MTEESTAGDERPVTAVPPAVLKIVVTSIVATAAYLVANVIEMSDGLRVTVSVVIGAATLVVQYVIDLQLSRDEILRRERRVEEKEAYRNLSEPDSLKILMDLNQRQIESYHQIVTRQARQSYRSAQVAMWCGILMLVGCLTIGLRDNATEIKVFVAAMGAVGTTMAGYLSRTYLSVYRDTLQQLNRYFDQPVKNGYFLAAERLAGDDMPHMREKIIEHMLEVSLRADLAATRKPRRKSDTRGNTGGNGKGDVKGRAGV